MALSPWYQGDTLPWTLPLTLDNNATFVTTSLTPSNFALLIRNTDANPPSEVSGTGVFTNLIAASGSTPAQITYAPSSADVATLGNFALFIVVTYPNSTVQTLSIGAWQVVTH